MNEGTLGAASVVTEIYAEDDTIPSCAALNFGVVITYIAGIRYCVAASMN